MNPRRLHASCFIAWLVSLFTAGLLLSPPAAAEPGQFIVRPVAEKKLGDLPPGPLYWRIENFSTLGLAQSAADAGPTSLAAEISGKVWLFTLGPKGGATNGGTKVVEIDPVPVFAAPEYLLRINQASGPPGSRTPVHSHPGSESFYVLASRVGQTTPHGTNRTDAGQSMVGHGPDMPMEVFSSGSIELDQLVMFFCWMRPDRPRSRPNSSEGYVAFLEPRRRWESKMNDRTVRAALERHWAASDAGDFTVEHEIYREDAVLDYPQSGERIRGRHNIQESRFRQPNKKRFTVRRMVGSGDLWVTEFVLSYDGKPSYTVSIMEFRDGQVAHETQYFADGFDPGPSRAHLVERMGESTTP